MNTETYLEGVRERLAQAIEDSGMSARAICLKAEVGTSYISGVLNEGKDPALSKLASVCEAMGVSFNYIVNGVDLSPESEKILQLLDQHPSRRDGILSILQS